MAGELLVPASGLIDVAVGLLTSVGVPAGDAGLAAEAITEADLRGVSSHGIRLLPGYLDRLRAGGLNPRPNLRVEREGPAMALLDGDNGLGHVVAARAMDLAISKAGESGVGVCAAHRSSHFGIAAFYALRAEQQGMIGLATTNSVAVIPPPGGREGRVGNTATAYALPSDEEPPIVLDIAMSAAARSRILMHAEAGTTIPSDWALDREGRPTTDPREAADGLLLPMAGHKGFGLALLWDALAGVLSGARFGTHVIRPPANEPGDIGHFMLAIDIRFFGNPADFRQKIDQVARTIRDTPRQDGVVPVHVPGENSHARRREHLAGGVPVPAGLVDRLNELAAQYGVAARIRSAPG